MSEPKPLPFDPQELLQQLSPLPHGERLRLFLPWILRAPDRSRVEGLVQALQTMPAPGPALALEAAAALGLSQVLASALVQGPRGLQDYAAGLLRGLDAPTRRELLLRGPTWVRARVLRDLRRRGSAPEIQSLLEPLADHFGARAIGPLLPRAAPGVVDAWIDRVPLACLPFHALFHRHPEALRRRLDAELFGEGPELDRVWPRLSRLVRHLSRRQLLALVRYSAKAMGSCSPPPWLTSLWRRELPWLLEQLGPSFLPLPSWLREFLVRSPEGPSRRSLKRLACHPDLEQLLFGLEHTYFEENLLREVPPQAWPREAPSWVTRRLSSTRSPPSWLPRAPRELRFEWVADRLADEDPPSDPLAWRALGREPLPRAEVLPPPDTLRAMLAQAADRPGAAAVLVECLQEASKDPRYLDEDLFEAALSTADGRLPPGLSPSRKALAPDSNEAQLARLLLEDRRAPDRGGIHLARLAARWIRSPEPALREQGFSWLKACLDRDGDLPFDLLPPPSPGTREAYEALLEAALESPPHSDSLGFGLAAHDFLGRASTRGRPWSKWLKDHLDPSFAPEFEAVLARWLQPPKTREARLEAWIQEDPSVRIRPEVWALAEARRQDWLDSLLQGEPLEGSLVESPTLLLPLLVGPFERYTEPQKEAYGLLLRTHLVEVQGRPGAEELVRSLKTRLQRLGPEALEGPRRQAPPKVLEELAPRLEAKANYPERRQALAELVLLDRPESLDWLPFPLPRLDPTEPEESRKFRRQVLLAWLHFAHDPVVWDHLEAEVTEGSFLPQDLEVLLVLPWDPLDRAARERLAEILGYLTLEATAAEASRLYPHLARLCPWIGADLVGPLLERYLTEVSPPALRDFLAQALTRATVPRPWARAFSRLEDPGSKERLAALIECLPEDFLRDQQGRIEAALEGQDGPDRILTLARIRIRLYDWHVDRTWNELAPSMLQSLERSPQLWPGFLRRFRSQLPKLGHLGIASRSLRARRVEALILAIQPRSPLLEMMRFELLDWLLELDLGSRARDPVFQAILGGASPSGRELLFERWPKFFART